MAHQNPHLRYPRKPDSPEILQLTPLELNDMHLSDRRTVLSPGYLEANAARQRGGSGK